MFEERNGTIYIGGEQVKKDVRDVLREQARYIQTSNFWEIVQATVLNEAANLALVQSKEWQQVETAKMLHHWQYVFDNLLHALSKE